MYGGLMQKVCRNDHWWRRQQRRRGGKWSHRKTHSGRAFSTVAKELLGDLCKAFASMTIHEAQKKGARYCRWFCSPFAAISALFFSAALCTDALCRRL